jgi:meso-butanediol dehydrogenase/(S,S)-butanediol dehydrogenase/diacetyl reductase
MLLQNKVVFLTGGTEGIGFECAKVYQKAGAKLGIISNCADSIAQAAEKFDNTNVIFIKADVAVAADIQMAIDKTVYHYGQIDVIHNNAGISKPIKTCA